MTRHPQPGLIMPLVRPSQSALMIKERPLTSITSLANLHITMSHEKSCASRHRGYEDRYQSPPSYQQHNSRRVEKSCPDVVQKAYEMCPFTYCHAGQASLDDLRLAQATGRITETVHHLVYIAHPRIFKVWLCYIRSSTYDTVTIPEAVFKYSGI